VHNSHMWIWTAAAVGIALVVARGVWLYWASLTWPTADGEISRIDIERKRSAGIPSGYYFCATFHYDFLDSAGKRASGTWSKNFSREENAREFGDRELPVGKRVVVRYSPKNPAGLNDLELDSWTYTGDRPTGLFS
jgi:hypothetical protein